MTLTRLLLMGSILSASGLAHAGAVVVGPGTEVAQLDQTQIKRIFLGRETTLAGNRLVVVLQKPGPARARFDDSVLGKPGAQLTAYWSKLVFTGKARAPEEVASDAEVKARVVATPGAIGYISDAAVDASVRTVFSF